MRGAFRTIGISTDGSADAPAEEAVTTHHAALLRIVAAIAAVILLLGLAGCRQSGHAGEEAFVGDRSVTLWTSRAQVRQPVATLHYGDRVEVVERQNEQARVRTDLGALGWTDQRNLMDSALWHRARELAERSRSMPVQARASADKLTNVHIEPGRAAPRTYQLRSGTPLEILERAVADFTRGGLEEGGAPGAGTTTPAETRREDWALVRAQEDPPGEIAGWVLRRFIKYEFPPELLEYSAQFRLVAWFELGLVPAGEAAPPPLTAASRAAHGAPGPPESVRTAKTAEPREKPQFLVAGIQGPEGQPCDFTLIRVYTWGAAHRRYETAYVESNLCGSLPIRVQPAGPRGVNAGFTFTNRRRGGEENREYVMHQTSVRRTDRRSGAAGKRPTRGSH